MSQLGRPKFVGARKPVMASCSAFASLIMMFVASSGLILAVRYYLELAIAEEVLGEDTYGMDLDGVIHVLRLDSQKQASEPFERAEVTADPEEVYLSESGLALWIVHSVPDAL